jgi:hypothetical protein
VLLTRPALLAATVRGSIDVPALAFTLFALTAVLKRRFVLALVLLGLAGLLRPEAWLLAFAVAVWWRRPAGFALALAAPVLWCTADLLATGDPLHSLTGTRALAEELNRPRSAPLAPLLVPRLISAVIGLPVLLAGAAALVALSAKPSRRFQTMLVALLLTLATFVAIGAAGLPLLARYLLPPAALLAILAAGVATTRGPALPRIAAVACLILAVPGTVTGVRDAARDSRERRALQADLHTLTRLPAFTNALERCPPLAAVTYRHVPVIAYFAHLPAAAIRPTPDSDLIVLPRSARAAESLQAAADSAPLLLQPPPDFRLAAQTGDWALAVRDGC